MKKLLLSLAGAATVFGLILFLNAAEKPNDEADSSARQAHPVAPAWSLKDLDGKTMKLSDFKGKVVVLNFWATWCGPCREEIPSLISLEKRFAPQGVEVVGISLDQQSAAFVRNFAKKLEINYPVVMGNREIAEEYGGIEAIPTTFIIDRKGRVAAVLQGAQQESEFADSLKSLL